MTQPVLTSVPGAFGNYSDTLAFTLLATQNVGDIITVGDRVGIVASIPAGTTGPAPIGTVVPVVVRGMINNCPKLSGQTWAVGDQIWYDPTGNSGAGTFQNTPARFQVGIAPNAQLSGDVTASVVFLDGDETIMGLAPAAVVSPANSGVEQVVANLKISANSVRVGSSFRVSGQLHQTGQNAADTLATKVRVGDVDGLTGAASSTLASVGATTGAVNKIVDFSLDITVISIGTGGTLDVRGTITNLAAPGTAAPVSVGAYALAINTTLDQFLAVTQLFSSNNAANTTEVRPGFKIEPIR